VLRTLCTFALVLAACGPRTGSTIPLVEAPPTPLPATGLVLAPGEEMVWDVYWQAMQVGRATLSVGTGEARSSFSTTALARAFAKVKYQLVSTPTSAREGLTMSGDASSISVAIDGAHYAFDGGPRRAVPGGTTLHTLHSAIGSVRAWSLGDAPPAYLWFVLRHTLYRLDVERPTGDEALGRRALKIHALARAIDQSIDPVDVTIWLSTTPERTPLRFVVVTGGERVSAELTETNAALAAN
jgi:hypothetical protein